MPYLCLMCNSEADDEQCEVCGAPTQKCEHIYQLNVRYSCSVCGALALKKVDSTTPDGLRLGSSVMRPCPLCQRHTMHNIVIAGIIEKPDYSSYLQDMYHKELKKDKPYA
jgi:hypothetical protein